MQIQQAIDDFLLYLEVEQNYSPLTIRSYDYDLAVFRFFLQQHHRSTELNDLTPSIVRRLIQDLMGNQKMKPHTMQRRISSLKSFSHYCLKEQWITSDFMRGNKAPKSDQLKKVYSFRY